MTERNPEKGLRETWNPRYFAQSVVKDGVPRVRLTIDTNDQFIHLEVNHHDALWLALRLNVAAAQVSELLPEESSYQPLLAIEDADGRQIPLPSVETPELTKADHADGSQGLLLMLRTDQGDFPFALPLDQASVLVGLLASLAPPSRTSLPETSCPPGRTLGEAI